MTVEAEFRCAAGFVEFGRFHLREALDGRLRTGAGCRLDMCLTKRPPNARARYLARWGPHRFERIGSLFLVRDTEPVHVRSEPGEGYAIASHLNAEAISAWFDDELNWTDHSLESSLDIECAGIKRLLQRMVFELRNPGFAHRLLVESLLLQLAVELRRYCTTIGDRKVSGGGLAPWRLRAIDERLTEGCGAPSLPELARLCQVSVRHLTRGFRVSRGCSIADYAAEKRLDQAKRMIGEGQTIKSVASALGFASPSSFTYSFRRSIGLTPCQFRESLAGTAGGSAEGSGLRDCLLRPREADHRKSPEFDSLRCGSTSQ